MPVHAVYIIFLFVLGASIGSFLNVVVWRLPRGKSLLVPPSHCPKCNQLLRWYDNIPIIGWLKLGGKCRYCKQPISIRYPLVEAATGSLLVFYYVMFFIMQQGPCAPHPPMVVSPFGPLVAFNRPLALADDWPIYSLYMLMVCGLLAASLIDAELFIIPLEIPWLLGAAGVIVHAVIDRPSLPGALNVSPPAAALAAGAALGLIISIFLWWRGIIPTSFPDGEPMLEVDRAEMLTQIERDQSAGKASTVTLPPTHSKSLVRAEIRKEMIFLLPPMVLGGAWVLATWQIDALGGAWSRLCSFHWFSGLMGSILGALVGGFVVWVTRILGTLGFGRVAMGLGDVHLMFGVGAVIGAGAATISFFLAPFFGILVALYMLITRTRRELPYGPYLSLATGFVILYYCPIADYLRPGLQGLLILVNQLLGIGQIV